MIRHAFTGARVIDMIDQLKPKLLVELGIGDGNFATLLMSYRLKPGTDYQLISISDNFPCPIRYLPKEMADNFFYVCGLSFEGLRDPGVFAQEGLKQSAIDMAFVDSDHNYYTVQKELEALYPRMSEKCTILFHDTETPATKDSVCERTAHYRNGREYPSQEIGQTLGKHFNEAIYEFVAAHPEFSILRTSKEGEGCIVIGRGVTLEIEIEKELVNV